MLDEKQEATARGLSEEEVRRIVRSELARAGQDEAAASGAVRK